MVINFKVSNLINITYNNIRGIKIVFDSINLPGITAEKDIITKSYPGSKFALAVIEANSAKGNRITDIWQVSHNGLNKVNFEKISSFNFSAVGKILIVY